MTADSHQHDHHELPTSGSALSSVALSATLHCLTGCAIGEIAGMAIATAIGLSDVASIALSIALAFVFGYSLTSLPLLRSGLALAAVVPVALASDTFSIGLMEIVDNLIIAVIPGALHAGLGDLLFWGSLSFSLAVAGAAAFPLNRWLIARGKGHTAVHRTGVHGGPPARLVGAIAVAALLFGSAVLIGRALDSGSGHGMAMKHSDQDMAMKHSDHDMAMKQSDHSHGAPSTDHAMGPGAASVRGLGATEAGLTLELARDTLPPSGRGRLSFKVVDSSGVPVRSYEVEHEKPMHLILARRDLTGFWHLHPLLEPSGTWSVEVAGPGPGVYRVYADFRIHGRNLTLARDLTVAGPARTQALPPPSPRARTATGYDVNLGTAAIRAGHEAELRFTITRGGRAVAVERYLGAGGHLVALRKADLAFLHVHPVEMSASGPAVRGRPVAFMTTFPAAGVYRLFLQFKNEGRVHTAAFTQSVAG